MIADLPQLHHHIHERYLSTGCALQGAVILREDIPVEINLMWREITLDDEFNEKVASPMYQDFSYASFSEGQKSRIDIALMLTWREIGRVKNSVNTNLLLLDEVFSSSLDDGGKENLLALLRYGLTDTNVMVVDHTLSAEFKDKFDRTVEVTKLNGFSKYD